MNENFESEVRGKQETLVDKSEMQIKEGTLEWNFV